MVVDQNLYPFKNNYMNLGKHRYHYIDEGQGEPMLMVHGNPTWSFYYRHLAREFSKTHRVVVPDHIGCGLSDKPNDEDYFYTLEQRVQDLEQLVLELDLRNITLVVHDWGGMIGMTFATRNADRIKKIVLFNTAAFQNPKGGKLPWTISICRNRAVGPFLVRGLNAFSIGASVKCFTRKKLPRSERDAYLAPYNNWHNRRAVLRFVQDIPLGPEDDSWSVLAEVEDKLSVFNKTPVLIIWGGKDFVFDDDFLAAWESYYPHAEVHRLNDAGHYVADDAHGDVIPIMHQFMTKHG
ncbi:alpha/beta fold hydrolase [Pseudobacteriovorax antillogorgiicola]|uniref:Haloalkane dehalogenase n=1 Tax=Pseudobacteriovorax antillogorgiicola TaxID=1513793 RepID=A0A1Y6BVJ2_9BACT|nr:alpha/beta fold hydrolase [Pseudobacteriovorax antillogorgiicola]TCS52278.1 haloalkane dehalogenase [Pseudobacteriovorax antillogorgiicola]SMF30722.1 haloalkane dehalogenase [Pseudobacteriovorax antillogorgiicola]